MCNVDIVQKILGKFPTNAKWPRRNLFTFIKVYFYIEIIDIFKIVWSMIFWESRCDDAGIITNVLLFIIYI